VANWYELHPGFVIPRNIDPSQFPPYTDFDPDLPDPLDLIVLPWRDPIPAWGWAVWHAAQRTDRLPRLRPDLLQAIAWRKYGSARYIALVPQWRRVLNELANEIDDIEDQVSTIIWLAELLGRKVLPIPPGVFGAADKLRHTLDAAQDVLRASVLTRSSKAEFREKVREQRAKVRNARTRLARVIQWLSDNYGRILEAAQATGTWLDFGIILGPIFGYIEEGVWGLAQKTLDNYLTAVDAFLPGYSEDFYANARQLNEQLELWLADKFEQVFQSAEEDAQWQGYFGM
jgi:hypothetical protein